MQTDVCRDCFVGAIQQDEHDPVAILKRGAFQLVRVTAAADSDRTGGDKMAEMVQVALERPEKQLLPVRMK